MKVAADKRGFQDIARKILGHRKRLGVGLSTLGRQVIASVISINIFANAESRALDHAGIVRLDELSTKLDGLTEGQLKLNDNINNKLAAVAEKQPLNENFAEILGSEIRPLEASIVDRFDQMSLDQIQNSAKPSGPLRQHIEYSVTIVTIFKQGKQFGAHYPFPKREDATPTLERRIRQAW
jgi:hypothetical protein